MEEIGVIKLAFASHFNHLRVVKEGRFKYLFCRVASMDLQLVRPKTTCTIHGTPTGTIEVSSASDNHLNVPDAFDFAEKQSGRLQTIGEALVTRVAFYDADKKDKSGLDNSNDYQRTSTVGLSMKNDGSFKVDAPYVVAFAELDMNEASRKLVQDGYKANNADKELIIPVNDASICDLIAQAKDTGRIAPALANTPLKLTTTQTNGKSAYGQHPNMIAAFGNVELAELNARYLSERGYKEGYLWDFTAKDFKNLLEEKEDHSHVCAVGLGGGDYCNVVANVNFDDYGRARSVIHANKK